MPSKTIYIKEADKELWEEAEIRAGGSLSGLLVDALRRYIEEEERKEHGMGTIELDLIRGESVRRVRFEGRWLVRPDQDETRSADPSGEAGFYYGVALTRRGNVAVYIDSVKPSVDAQLETYASLDAAAAEGTLPEDIYEMADAEMGSDYVQDLDI